jgi:tRNA(Ile2)-agmatinylcytidine synthase
MIVSLGFDDHDSPAGGCTTHFLYQLLNKKKFRLVDLPYLVRLNPNVPWKTRGNASVKIRVEYEGDLEDLADELWQESDLYVREVSRGYNFKRSPGLAIIRESYLGQWSTNLYENALSDVLLPDAVREIGMKHGAILRGGRGIVGALASMGFSGKGTYEVIIYRKEENWGRPRNINKKVIRDLDSFFPNIFYNYDYLKDEPLVQSRGQDPVLVGIRGTDPNLLNSLRLDLGEEAVGSMLFKTNQHMDHHLLRPSMRPYGIMSAECIVEEIRKRRGGDVLLKCGNEIMLVFKETRELNAAAAELEPGDRIHVLGSVRPSSVWGKVVELERIELLELVRKVKTVNPTCPVCGGSGESLGRRGGFRCRRCGNKFILPKKNLELPRRLSLGVYQSPLYRHVSKPLFLNE